MAEVSVTATWSDNIVLAETQALQAVGGRVEISPTADAPSGPGIVISPLHPPVVLGPATMKVRSPDGAATLVHYPWPAD